MKKRLLSLVLAIMLMLSAFPVIPVFAGDAWNGSDKAEPVLTDGAYQIGTGAELAWFAEASKTNSAVNAVLTADIDLGGKEWTPIGIPASGYITEAFSGVFDGQGHTISNLSINTGSAFYGLFYCVYGGTVKNLNVIGNVKTTGNTAGGIVGKLQGGTVENCSFGGSVTASKNYVGGIVGNIVTNKKAQSVIKGCVNTAEITGKTAGGILGYTTAKAEISYCYNTGTVNGTTRSAGISGQQTTGKISYCYNIGKSNNGISGFSNADVINCYYLNDEVSAPGGSASGYEKITDKDKLLASLNAGEEKFFCEDKLSINNGYPVLEWQMKSAFKPVAIETVEISGSAVTGNTLSASVIGKGGEEATNVKYQWSVSDNGIDFTDISGADSDSFILPDTYEYLEKYIKITVTGDEDSSAEAVIGPVEKSEKLIEWENNVKADPELYLQAVLDAMQWNFNQLQPIYGKDTNMLVKFTQLLESKGYDGITVTVNSTEDESLVSENGKINYPVNENDSYADGKQVKVFFNLTVGGKTVVYPAVNNYSLLIPWNTDNVKASLEAGASEFINENTILGENEAISAVSKNLVLPSNIKGDKYSFAWVTWESSDEKHLAVSDENRHGSADALYNPFVGKVYQDAQEHTVTLTATITNPSTEVTVTREFTVVISALTDDELNQSIDTMRKILDCYTEDKLTDYSTGRQLDIDAVDNDIQLVIPSKVVTAAELEKINYGKYWDYWNYKFTASSSDTDVIEINSFRAYVYRPIGEDSSADKTVTITVKMESKANPNLYVTKDIDVTVKHLSREDINNALGLMDKAKDSYAEGLLGSNADVYSVIDNLIPYNEIVWNKDKSDVEFIYTNKDVKGSGVIVDTLPNWEEQEDWRLFRTSNKDLISNETLILNETPADDTFVKINSVLTDESLGKYYTKFCNAKGYDAEALAKFKQLYKQPVSAYVMVVGDGGYTDEFAVMSENEKAELYSAKLSVFKNEVDKPISVTFTLLGLDGKTIISKVTENSFNKGATVFDVFKKVIADNNMYYSAKGSYISSINGLAEKDYGSSSGWMYTVGNVFVNSYMNAQELSGGEDIVVMYVRDYADANKAQIANPPADNNNSDNTDNDNSSADNTVSIAGGTPVGSSGSLKPSSDKASSSVKNADSKKNTADNNSAGSEASAEENEVVTDDKAVSAQNDDSAVLTEGAPASEKNGNTILWIALAAALAVALIIIFIIIKKRKNKNKE